MNWKAVDAGISAIQKVDVPASWLDTVDAKNKYVEKRLKELDLQSTPTECSFQP